MEYESRVTQYTIVPKGQPIFSEFATEVLIEDEAAGEFIVIRQGTKDVKIDVIEWEHVKKAVDKLVEDIIYRQVKE
jgi:hypothetical protein